MADNYSNSGASASSLSAEGSDSTVLINIKTLNSHIYTFQVDKNMPISSFKEDIANEIGIPVNQQRLIFRGKVLKDEHLLSEYPVENGDTLHLVERQPAQSQPSGGSAGEAGSTSGNQGTANQAQSGQLFSSQALQYLPQAVQIPLAAQALPIPSLYMPIPDSLTTMSEFMSLMEQTLSQDGSNSSSADHSDSRHVNLPTNALGIPTSEALSIILRQAERLLSSNAVAALSYLAERLERDSASSDPSMRDRIQAESMQIGVAMQQFGALMLELGRTLLTLRLGQSAEEYVVNAGPAIYISPTAPNPIMVQPFPLQTSSLFGSSVPPSSATFGPVASRSAPLNINIHLHDGPALAPVVLVIGARPNYGEWNQDENSNDSSSLDSGSLLLMPFRNIIAATIPLSPTGVEATSASQSELVSEQQSGSDSLSSILADINSQLRNCIGESQGDSVNRAGEAETRAQDPSDGSGSQSVPGSVQDNNTTVQNGVQISNVSLDGSTPENESEKEYVEKLRRDLGKRFDGDPEADKS